MSVIDVEPTATGPEFFRTVQNVECVACPACGFTFSAEHESDEGGYDCPQCAVGWEQTVAHAANRALDDVVKREAEFQTHFTDPCEACRGEGTLITNYTFPHGCNGYYERVDCGECQGWGRIPKRSE